MTIYFKFSRSGSGKRNQSLAPRVLKSLTVDKENKVTEPCMDLSKAIDSVSHFQLLHSLSQLHIQNNSLKLDTLLPLIIDQIL